MKWLSALWLMASHRLMPFILPGVLGGLWLVCTNTGVLPVQVLPAPQTVLHTLSDQMESGELWSNVEWSLMRVGAGFFAGSAIALLLGVSMALNATVRDYLYPTFNVLIYVPVLAWLPLLMLVLGLGEAFKIVLIAKAVLVPMTIQTYNAVRDVSPSLAEMGMVNRLRPLQVVTVVVLPAAFPALLSGLRYAHSRAWAVLVVVELLASSEGLGFLIGEGQQLLQLDVVVAAIMVLGVIAYALDRLLASPEVWIRRWNPPGFDRSATLEQQEGQS